MATQDKATPNKTVRWVVYASKGKYYLSFYKKDCLKSYCRCIVTKEQVVTIVNAIRKAINGMPTHQFCYKRDVMLFLSSRIADSQDIIGHFEMKTNAFQGGTYRQRYLFPLYYNPLKILQYYDVVWSKGSKLFFDDYRFEKCHSLKVVREGLK